MNVAFIIGTRPEGIKLAPLIKTFKKHPDKFKVTICATSQQVEMLDSVLSFFSIRPDFTLSCNVRDQNLFNFATKCLSRLGRLLKHITPDLVFVQGNTSTAFIGSIAGYYNKSKIAHIEAGLRTNNRYSPFPEEMHRMAIGQFADYHFAPTATAVNKLFAEGVTSNVWNVGNTGIDALLLGLELLRNQNERMYFRIFNKVDFSKRILVFTIHRRENFGKPFNAIAEALKSIARGHNDIEVIFPVHPNPQIRKPAFRLLGGLKNVHLFPPIIYPAFIWLMKKSFFVITDSGGIQEEASFLKKPALILRNDTERIEGVHGGVSRLVGSDRNRIVHETELLFNNKNVYHSMVTKKYLYGNGTACSQILRIINRHANEIYSKRHR